MKDGGSADSGRRWLMPVVVGLIVAIMQCALVAAIGTDIPFQDQWDVEGRTLYPRWLDGALGLADLFAAHNEHRIFWTRLANLALFAANGGRWDPLLQLTLNALLHGLAAALAASHWTELQPPGVRRAIGSLVALGMIPVSAWHNAVWGFQSQAYFAILWGFVAIALWLRGSAVGRWGGGFACIAAMLSMAPGALVPAGLLAAAAIGWRDRRPRATELAALGSLLLLGISLTRSAADVAELRASPGQWLLAFSRMLAWPHVDQPLAAFVVNAPLAWLGFSRLRGRRGTRTESMVTAAAAWVIALAAAIAWGRGGSAEFAVGVPSRYVDFLVLLPLANCWSVALLLRLAISSQRARLRLAVTVWAAFVAVGWLGLSWQMAREIILPRARDREAPVRLAREFHATRNPAAFAGQPRLLVPHPNPSSVLAVLDEPRLAGRLPPSLQPEEPYGRLSRVVRVGLRWEASGRVAPTSPATK